MRVFATQSVAQLMNVSPLSDYPAPTALSASRVQTWHVQLLLPQIYDPAPEVCALAVRVLERACQSLDTLEKVVTMRPSLDHLGETGTGLLTR